jgi:hypothetical protein
MAKKRIKWFIKQYNIGDDVDREFWAKVPGSKKMEYVWNMVVEAMHLKGTPEKLKFKKVFRVLKKDPSCPW